MTSDSFEFSESNHNEEVEGGSSTVDEKVYLRDLIVKEISRIKLYVDNSLNADDYNWIHKPNVTIERLQQALSTLKQIEQKSS
jgi:hypothetical protein